MADERTKKPFDQKSPIPQGYNWPSLLKKDVDDLLDHCRRYVEHLSVTLAQSVEQLIRNQLAGGSK